MFETSRFIFTLQEETTPIQYLKGKLMKRTIAILVIALAFSLIGSASAQQKKAPNFKLKTSGGTTYELQKKKGKVIIVNFWATWCGPCIKEIPDFIELHKKYKSKGVEFVGIALDKEGWENVIPFLKENKINYPVVLGDSVLAASYGGIQYIPTTFIVDRNGNIVDEHTGMFSKAALESKIKPYLKKGV
jgi:thiol-disulfide isomerase/thioredoxin